MKSNQSQWMNLDTLSLFPYLESHIFSHGEVGEWLKPTVC